MIHYVPMVQKVRNIQQIPVDLKALMDGLSSLMLPFQKAMFSPHMYVLHCSFIVVHLVILDCSNYNWYCAQHLCLELSVGYVDFC